jgi:hypothetical protein
VFVTAKPLVGNEEDDIDVVAGTSNVEVRFVGKVRRFRPTAFPKSIEMLAMGTLAYAAEWAQHEEILFDEVFPSGATDQDIVQWALGFVPGVTFTAGNIGGTGITLGVSAPEAFNWSPGTSAWSYIQQLDRATLYRTYQAHDGTIYRVQMIGHPNETPSFTLTDADVLDGSTSSRNTEQTRNAAVVRGHDYGRGEGPVLGLALGVNDFQGDATDPALRHPEEFSSDLIEDGNDEDGGPAGETGLNAQDIADTILNDVNKEFVEASIRTWRDDIHGPGMTALLEGTQARLALEGPFWVQDYAWEVGTGGWVATYGLTGGGLPQDYVSPPV